MSARLLLLFSAVGVTAAQLHAAAVVHQRHVLAAAGAARRATGELGGNRNPYDPFFDSNCNCTTFCDGSCTLNTSLPGPANLTFYRMTPPDVLALENKNTGDAPGDDSFVLQRRTLLEQCLQDPKNPICRTVLQNTTGSNSTDVILQLQYEVDGQWGPYQFCNPVDPKKQATAPWNCTAAPTNASMSAPSDFPQGACSDIYAGFSGVCYAPGAFTKHTTLADVDMGDCCAAALKAGPAAANGTAPQWTYNRTSRTCVVFPVGTREYHADENCVGAVLKQYVPAPTPPCECDRVRRAVGREDLLQRYGAEAKASFPAGGLWFSHTGEGECTGGARPRAGGGAGGCSWRHVATTSKVAAACVYDRIDAAVVALDAPCFAKCPSAPGGGPDTASRCYLQCYARTVYAATREQLTAPWNEAFAGGCPQV